MAQNQMNKYVWLVDTIHCAGKISLEDINRKWLDNDLSEGIEIPKRTFHKWRIAIEEMFGLIIENENRGEYRYFILNDDEIEKKGIKSWMIDTISTSNLLINNVSLKDRIILDDVPSGREFLQPILGAMKQNRLIHITYYNYWRDDERQYYLKPLCVKLFRQRWYMVGESWSTERRIIFCLDRIRDFRLSSHTFEYPDDFLPEEYFDGCYGIIAGDDTDTEKVVLKVNSGQANYIRDLKLHESQVEKERNDQYSVFELRVKPTFDFQQEILWNGEDMEVIEPIWLRKEIAGKVKRMWNKYKKN